MVVLKYLVRNGDGIMANHRVTEVVLLCTRTTQQGTTLRRKGTLTICGVIPVVRMEQIKGLSVRKLWVREVVSSEFPYTKYFKKLPTSDIHTCPSAIKRFRKYQKKKDKCQIHIFFIRNYFFGLQWTKAAHVFFSVFSYLCHCSFAFGCCYHSSHRLQASVKVTENIMLQYTELEE